MSAGSDGSAEEHTPAAVKSDAPAPQGSVEDTPGKLLRDERSRRGLSVQQAADDLHLDTKLIQALEANDFQALGPPVYAKGHLRKYATLLGLAPEVVLASYHQLADEPVAPAFVPLATAPLRPQRRVSWVVPAVVATLVLGAVLAWTLQGRSRSGDAADVADVGGASTPLETTELDAPGPATAPLTTPMTAPTTAPTTASKTAPMTTTTAPPPVVAPVKQSPAVVAQPDVPTEATRVRTTAAAEGTVTLRLQFAAASWVEVYDAAGQRLMFGIGQPGQTRTLSGIAPLKVNLGLAAAVNAEVNARAIAIPRRAGKDAARFVVAADGTVT